jgi:hypothetical protein
VWGNATGRRAPRARAVAAVGALCALALAWGYRLRDELYFSPEAELGYALGVLGTACMLLLLLYSLRKRVGALARLGPIRGWFQIHMMLGLLAPTAILFHCNFQVGAVNSGVALACMLLVAGSGLIGRFLYPRIHHGLSDRRATLSERRAELDAQRGALAGVAAAAPELAAALQRFEADSLAPATGAARIWRLALLGQRGRGMVRRARRASRRRDARERSALLRGVRAYVGSVRQVARFGAYERVFALWHAIHLPLCVLLFTATAVHVVAVHMY